MVFFSTLPWFRLELFQSNYLSKPALSVFTDDMGELLVYIFRDIFAKN